jgi:hypothetical protein
MAEFNFANPKLKLSDEAMKETAESIQKAFDELV